MSYNPFSLTGKNILITGASSGIGRATAIACSKMGARLVITGRNVERLQETMSQLEGDGHQQVIAELTEEAHMQELVERCKLLNGVVLCAGMAKTLPMAFASRDKLDEMFDVNFFAPFELLRGLNKKKKLEKGASVVFVASIGGVMSYKVGNGLYGVSKAALTSAMKFFALELAAKKIRVNSVHPGMTNTPLIHRGTITDEQLRTDEEQYPLKRYGDPIDIAHGIIYLLSDASSWVTGHTLVIDGGVSL